MILDRKLCLKRIKRRLLGMKRKIKILLFFIGLFFLGFMPNNVEALQCKYNIRINNDKELEPDIVIFRIDTNSSAVELPKIDNTELKSNPAYYWNLFDNYADFYLKQSKKNGKFHCPNVVVHFDTSAGAIPRATFEKQTKSDEANKYYAFEPETIVEASDDEKKIGKITGSCSSPVMVVDAEGIDTIDESYTVSFTIDNSRNKQWSIDDSVSQPITGYSEDKWRLSYDSGNKDFYLSKVLLNTIYKNSSLDVSCPEKVYACKTNTGNGDYAIYKLYLSPDCSNTKKDYLNNISLDGMNQSISCGGLFADQNEGSVYWLLQKILNYMKLLGPILVVLLSSVDFIKAVMSSDENALKVAQKKLMVRLVAAIALFLLPSLIQLIISLLGGIIDSNCLLQ